MDKARETRSDCAIYCRLSREDTGKLQESESIHNQKSLLLDYAARQGWGVYAVYCDEDYSGVDRERPAWNALLRDARAGMFGTILCKTQSRFTRDMELVERYIHGLFPLWGIRFVAVLDNIDTAVQGNKKARQINGLVNEWYLEDLSENIRAVFAQKRREGRYIGSFPVYGYRKDPADHNRLLEDAESAAVVRRIFRLCLDGMGTQRIATLLNGEGVPNPTRYKRAAGLAYSNGSGDGAGLWNHTTVSRILRNEMYVGTMVQGTKRRPSYKSRKLLDVPRDEWVRVDGTHAALVGREVFDVVQRMLAGRTRAGDAGTPHLLAGRVFCLDCGAPLVKSSYTYKGVRTSYLRCGRHAAAPAAAACTSHSIRLDLLEAEFRLRFADHLHSVFSAEALLRMLSLAAGKGEPEAEDAPAGEYAERSGELAKTQRELDRLSSALRSLYLDKVDGVISAEQFTEMNRSFLSEQARLQKNAARLRDALAQPPSTAEAPGGKESRAAKLLEQAPRNRALINLLVARVEVGEAAPRPKGRKKAGELVPGTQAREIRILWREPPGM